MLLVIGGTVMAAERVPDAAVVGGVPQGMFVSRSLLTGRAVCLLFLSGGRVTRAIPEGGLESFDWTKHQAAHRGDGLLRQEVEQAGDQREPGNKKEHRGDEARRVARKFYARVARQTSNHNVDARGRNRRQCSRAELIEVTA